MEENILGLEEKTKYQLTSKLLFTIDDYDIRLFLHEEGKIKERLIDINTYPHSPYSVIGKYFIFSK